MGKLKKTRYSTTTHTSTGNMRRMNRSTSRKCRRNSDCTPGQQCRNGWCVGWNGGGGYNPYSGRGQSNVVQMLRKQYPGNNIYGETIDCSTACSNPHSQTHEGPPSGGQFNNCMGICSDMFGCSEGVNMCV